MSHVTISKETLIPVSLVITLGAIIYWAAGIASAVQAQGQELIRIKSERASLEAEIVQQLRSQGIDIQDLRLDSATTKANVALILKLLEKKDH